MSLSISDTINEYYKLKSKYESDNAKNKSKIIRNPKLSWKEKVNEYQKLKPKCINCKRPGGTIFSTNFYPEKYEENKYQGEFRQLKAMCGIISDPCNLNITLNVGSITSIPSLLKNLEKEIAELKNIIIDDKNKLLFGYITTEEALEKFNDVRDLVEDNTSTLQLYLDEYYKIVDNKDISAGLREDIENSYLLILEIKECMKNFNLDNNNQYVNDAVNIYTYKLKPLLEKIMKLKYKENMVWYNEDDNTYHLIQNKYTIADLEHNQGTNLAVVKYDVGLKKIQSKKSSKKTKLLIIDSEDEMDQQEIQLAEEQEQYQDQEPQAQIQTQTQPQGEEEYQMSVEAPIYNSDGTVTWSKKENQDIWNKFNPKLKQVLLTNHEWLEDFVNNCTNLRKQGKPCKFISPPDLILPPMLDVDTGKYDLGNEYYNNLFNNSDKSYQATLLTLYSVKNGIKNYTPLEETLTKIAAKDLNFVEYV